MEETGEVDVMRAVRQLQLRRPEFIVDIVSTHIHKHEEGNKNHS